MKHHTLTASARVAVVLLALTFIAEASVAHADTLLFSRGGGEQVISDDGYDFLSDDQFTQSGFIAAQYAVLYEVYAGLEFSSSEETFEPFTGLSSDLDVYSLMATVRLEHQVTGWFVPYLQAGAGVYYVNLKLDFQDETREQDVWEPAFMQLAGLEFMVPRRFLRKSFQLAPESMWWDFTVGLALEAGYQHVGTVEFDGLERPEPDKKPEPEDELLPADSIAYGDLDLSGFMLRFGLHVHF